MSLPVGAVRAWRSLLIVGLLASACTGAEGDGSDRSATPGTPASNDEVVAGSEGATTPGGQGSREAVSGSIPSPDGSRTTTRVSAGVLAAGRSKFDVTLTIRFPSGGEATESGVERQVVSDGREGRQTITRRGGPRYGEEGVEVDVVQRRKAAFQLLQRKWPEGEAVCTFDPPIILWTRPLVHGSEWAHDSTCEDGRLIHVDGRVREVPAPGGPRYEIIRTETLTKVDDSGTTVHLGESVITTLVGGKVKRILEWSVESRSTPGGGSTLVEGRIRS